METTQAQDASLTGNVMLYTKPELLSRELHGKLGINPTPSRFAFAAKAHVCPLTVPEFGPASITFPIIFVGDERQPVAVMGMTEGQNLFANETMGYDADAYIPAYIRRYPFVLAASAEPAPAGEDQRMLVGIDRAYPHIVENAQFPFFENGEPTEYTKSCIQFCNDFETQNRLTQSFVQLLKDLDMFETRDAKITPQNADGTPGETQTLATFWAVSETKLNAMAPDKLAELRNNGALAQIYAHLNSLFNWERLLLRASERMNPPAANQ